MKKTDKIVCFVLMSLFFLTGSISIFSEEDNIQLSEDLEIVKIESGVFVVIHSAPWPSNSLLVQMGPMDFVLADTPWDNTTCQILHDWLVKKYGQVKIVAINTHFHRDCLGGNHYLISRGIPVYGSDLTASLFKEKGERRAESTLKLLKEKGYKRPYKMQKNSKLVAPSHIFKINEGLKLKVNDEEVNVFYPGPGHSKDNVVVYFPKRDILFAGCILKAMNWKSLGYLGDAEPQKWAQSLNILVETYGKSRIIIPGHGMWGNIDLIHHTIGLVNNHNNKGKR